VPAADEHVGRAFERGLHPVAVELHRHPYAALLELPRRRAGGEEEEGALGAEEVGRRHGGELGAVELVRREGDRHPQHGRPDVVLAQDRPERLRLAKQPELRLVERNAVLADLQEPVDRADLGRGDAGQVGLGVPVEEVEDVVLGRRGAGREGRPGDRRDRRVGRGQAPVRALLGQLLEVGELALRHQPVGDLRVLAVEPDHDQPLDLGLDAAPAPDHPPRRPERPDEERQDRQHDGGEQHQERGEQREARSRSHVGGGRCGGTEQPQQQERHDRWQGAQPARARSGPRIRNQITHGPGLRGRATRGTARASI